MRPSFTRRRVLGGVAAAGFLTLGVGWGASAMRPPPYTKYTYAQTDSETGDSRLRVAWYETYNGAFQEAQNASTETNGTRILDPASDPEYVDEAAGPVITLNNLMPGDSGKVVIGLGAQSIPEDESGMDVWVNTELLANRENGVTEPERKDPEEDDPGGGASTGELADALQSTFWLDSGPLGTFGACDGVLGLGDSVIRTGSLLETFNALNDGVQIGTALDEGDHVCLGFEWGLPADVGNKAQTDSVEFDVTFVGRSAGAGNPFSSDGGSP